MRLSYNSSIFCDASRQYLWRPNQKAKKVPFCPFWHRFQPNGWGTTGINKIRFLQVMMWLHHVAISIGALKLVPVAARWPVVSKLHELIGMNEVKFGPLRHVSSLHENVSIKTRLAWLTPSFVVLQKRHTWTYIHHVVNLFERQTWYLLVWVIMWSAQNKSDTNVENTTTSLSTVNFWNWSQFQTMLVEIQIHVGYPVMATLYSTLIVVITSEMTRGLNPWHCCSTVVKFFARNLQCLHTGIKLAPVRALVLLKPE